MADMIVNGTEFNVEDIKYSAPKANASGGKSINILNKKTSSMLRMSTPLMLTWGATDFVDPSTGKGNGKYDMSLQFPNGEYATEETRQFLGVMTAFESKIKADALTFSKEWFGRQHKNAEVVDALWSPMLRYSKDRDSGEADMTKAPTLRIKVPIWNGTWGCEVYDLDENKLFPNAASPSVTPLDYILKGTNVACVIQCGGLWFANGKFGLTWKLSQVVVQPKKAFALTGKCYIKLNSTDKERLKSAAPVVASQNEDDDEEGGVASAYVADSDDEQEPEAAVVQSVFKAPATTAAPTPTPAPAPLPEISKAAVAAEVSAEVGEEKKVKKIIKKKVVTA